MASRFLFNETLWNELETRIPRAKVVRVAVAYLGSSAETLLPLRKGDTLVVDMSLRAVRSGTTDPRQVEKFLKRGVAVFSRESLHAKFFLIDDVLIAGSSNISRHAKDALDEAAILTNDSSAWARASATADALCTEPVRKEYLRKCLKEYRPPRFGGQKNRAGTGRTKIRHAKVWIIAGLIYRDVPATEAAMFDQVIKKSEKRLLDFERSKVDYTHYSRPMKFFKELREGDWVVTCIRDGKGFDVWPPMRLLGLEDYLRFRGRRRYILTYEMPTGAQPIRWPELRHSAPSSVLALRRSRPRTTAITDDVDADAILRLWNRRGRFRGRTNR